MYEKLVEKYYQDIFRWSFAKTKNRFDAEDLTQEIIYQIIKVFNKNNLILEPEKYIWKIAYYTWCDRAKEYVKSKFIINDDLILVQAPDEKTDILKEIELEELKEKLRSIIDTFGNTMKNIVDLYYYKDQKVNQISETLCIKESLVKYYLYEARNKIKEKMEEF